MLEYHDPMKPDENSGMNTGTQPQQQMRPQMPPEQRPVKKEKKDSFGKKLGRTVILALVFGLVAGIVFLGVGLGGAKLRNRNDVEKEYSDKDYEELREELENLKEEQQQTSAKVETEEDEDDKDDTSDDSQDIDVQQVSSSAATTTLDYDVADIVEKTQPSIVSITTTGTTQYQYFFQTYEQPTSGAGSGIIIGQDDDVLYVATNYHVIKDSDEIKVGFNDGEVVNAEVKGYDEDEDVAVVTVPKSDMKDSTKDAVTVASIGDSTTLQVGEPAIAIGNALGYGQSVTVGYISALNRTVEGSDGTFIQTDAAINPGNSGGALINSKGEVIGINSVKYVDSTVEGMGFSIPINEAMSIINDVISGVQKAEPYLGVTGAAIDRQYAQVYGFPMGIYVKEIESGSPAENADLHAGDIIVEFDGQEVYTNDALESLIKKCDDGDNVEMVVYRADETGNYEKMTLNVTLSAK